MHAASRQSPLRKPDIFPPGTLSVTGSVAFGKKGSLKVAHHLRVAGQHSHHENLSNGGRVIHSGASRQKTRILGRNGPDRFING
jgi:hypothetical protein